jgi:hypothetical protein
MLGSGLDGLSMFFKIGIVPMNEPILLQILDGGSEAEEGPDSQISVIKDPFTLIAYKMNKFCCLHGGI